MSMNLPHTFVFFFLIHDRNCTLKIMEEYNKSTWLAFFIIPKKSTIKRREANSIQNTMNELLNWHCYAPPYNYVYELYVMIAEKNTSIRKHAGTVIFDFFFLLILNQFFMIQKNSDLIKPIMNVYDMKKNSVLTHLVPRQITKDFQMLTFFHTTNLFNLSLYRSKQSYMMMLSCLFACSLFEERNGNNINARSCCLSSAKIFFVFCFIHMSWTKSF